MKLRWVIIPVIALIVLAIAILPFLDTGGGEQKIRISGAFALYPMVVKWAEEYQTLHPDIKIDVAAGGAGKGVADTLGGLVDIGMVSRELTAEEKAQGAVFVPVVKDAVFATINKDNPVAEELMAKGMTKEQFTMLWIEGSPLQWGDIAGTIDETPVSVYTRSDSCGAAETWAKYLGNKKQEDLKGIGVYGDPGIAEAATKDANAIAYNNLNYAYDMTTGLPVEGLLVVPIDINGNGKVDPEEALDTKAQAVKSINDGVYPSPPARALYMMVKDTFQGPAKDFLAWTLTDGQKYTDEVGYIQLKEDDLAKAVATVKG